MDLNSKKSIDTVFDSIATHYDFLNHLLSFNIDRLWRRQALKGLPVKEKRNALDVACGTGDFALALQKKGCKHTTGIDISKEMLKIGREKIKKRACQNSIDLVEGSVSQLPFEDNTFDLITVAFGVRNFDNRQRGLEEMYRVLQEHAPIVILEFSVPHHYFFKGIYQLYFRYWLPLVGGCVSGNKEAYNYLPDSVYDFPSKLHFVEELKQTGFSMIRTQSLSMGIATVYYATK